MVQQYGRLDEGGEDVGAGIDTTKGSSRKKGGTNTISSLAIR